MAEIYIRPSLNRYVLIIDKEEAKALAIMISGASLEERRIFFPVLCKMKKMGLI